MELKDLIIDEELRNLIPPLSVEEFNQLEQNIITDGIVREPIVIWKDENIICDGHNRYKILLDHPEIPFTICEKEFASRYDVIEWMCANQLGRRNLSELQRTVLLGTAYEARKKSHASVTETQQRDEHGHFISGCRQNGDNGGSTRHIVANDYNVGVRDVERSGRFVRGLNEIESKFPGTTRKIQTGELEVTKKDVMALTSLEGKEKDQAIEDIVQGKRIYKPLDDSRAPQEEHEAYNIDDFRSELQRKVMALDKNLELTCVLTHKDFLNDEEGKEVLRDVLLQMTEVIKKYFAMCD